VISEDECAGKCWRKWENSHDVIGELAGDICPYGIDPWLWLTHFGKLVTTFLISCYADTLELSRAALYGQTMARVLFFVNVKAVLNTVMVYTGWKRPGAFKVTQKAGGAAVAAGGSAGEVKVAAQPEPPVEMERDNGGPTIPVRSRNLFLLRLCPSIPQGMRGLCLAVRKHTDQWH
jgi:hypothetical protein